MIRDEFESSTSLEKLSFVEFIFEAVYIRNEDFLVLFTPFVVDFYLLIFVKDERLVQEGHLIKSIRIVDPIPNPVFILVVTDGLD